MNNVWCESSDRYRQRCLSLAIVLVMALHLPAAETPPLVFPVGEPPFAAELVGIDREWNVSFKAAGKVRVVAAADLAYWGRQRDAKAGALVLLADGGLIRADVLKLDDQQLILGAANGLGRGGWDESRLPRAAIRAILWQPPAGSSERDRLLRDLFAYRQANDRLLLVGGDEARGQLFAVPPGGRFAPQDAPADADMLQFAPGPGGEPLLIPATKVIAATFGAKGQAKAALPPRSAWIGFSDGTLVHAQSLSVKGDAVSIGLTAAGKLHLAVAGGREAGRQLWKSITYLEPISPRLIWLADLPPLGYKHIPILSVSRPFGANACLLGTKLRSGDAVFSRGISMPSASRLAYDVTGYRKFEAEIAVDAAAGLSGSVIVKVLLEQTPNHWTTAYESGIIRGGDAPAHVSLDLQNATRMALLIDFADYGDVCDYANWLHARLTK